MQLVSTLTCPDCGFAANETMPTDACQFFYDCKGCGIRLKPKAGDCCVFCSYGSVPCPPVQAGGSSSGCTVSRDCSKASNRPE
ncbi:GDCCVxC domain-containing (seleno)protein [Bradyrhizobium genosp. L]|uniref:GDCCVxC domain-containing (seleno)protein n=1 Tax=Bradyrhizobium genosp. L TaxID=83637 RepID=UPI001FEFD838|nr:GDCCVxC domain-containing (seleno)protein [Bradyrhizobium genosp. L]